METPKKNDAQSTAGSTPRSTADTTKKVETGRSRRTSTGEEGGSSSLNLGKNGLLAAVGALAGGALLYKGAKALAGSSPEKRLANHQKSVVTVTTSLIVKKPRTELYAYWRNLENLPNFMSHIEDVTEIDDTTSTWTAEIPAGLGTIEWEAEIIREEEDHLLIWRSIPGSEIENSGEVRFEDVPGGKGTIVETTISYRPPAGDVAGLAAKLVTPAFKKVVENDLKQFKKFMEKGGKPKRKSTPKI